MLILCEKVLDRGNKMFVCFNYEKALDRVKWVKLMDISNQLGMNWRDRKLICELYTKQQAVVRVVQEETNPCIIGRGEGQGCSLSPLLFSIYADKMMEEAQDSVK